jgi:hypothetical protein
VPPSDIAALPICFDSDGENAFFLPSGAIKKFWSYSPFNLLTHHPPHPLALITRRYGYDALFRDSILIRTGFIRFGGIKKSRDFKQFAAKKEYIIMKKSVFKTEAAGIASSGLAKVARNYS